ncbi:MAG: hypothetical protein CL917_02240 [Deltaproteobacteria bacterium]|nr:hypothetical protein [Deltaproteobacteria bacterium]
MVLTSSSSVQRRFFRATRIGTTFARIYVGVKFNQLLDPRSPDIQAQERWSKFNRRSAQEIYAAAIELRGLILKGCQFLGARADALPPEYVQVLSSLQDRVPPHPLEEIQAQIELELRAPLRSVFSEFSESAMASASLAQVHEALLPNGQRVAVKVQYPEVENLIHFDLANLNTLFKAVGLLERDFDLAPLIAELGEHVPNELDFVHEGINAERVSDFFDHREDLYVPRIHWEMTTRRVLVSDFVSGIKINDLVEIDRADFNREEIMTKLIEAYCEQVFVHGFFHADPHPGNLMVRAIPGTEKTLQIVFLDFGLAKELPHGFRKAILEFTGALLGGNTDAMAGALLDLGFETRGQSLDSLKKLAAAFHRIASRLRYESHLAPDIIQEAGRELPRLIREDPIIRIPSHLVLLGRVLALLSGLGRTLEVKVDMLQIILPYMASKKPTTYSRSKK